MLPALPEASWYGDEADGAADDEGAAVWEWVASWEAAADGTAAQAGGRQAGCAFDEKGAALRALLAHLDRKEGSGGSSGRRPHGGGGLPRAALAGGVAGPPEPPATEALQAFEIVLSGAPPPEPEPRSEVAERAGRLLGEACAGAGAGDASRALAALRSLASVLGPAGPACGEAAAEIRAALQEAARFEALAGSAAAALLRVARREPGWSAERDEELEDQVVDAAVAVIALL